MTDTEKLTNNFIFEETEMNTPERRPTMDANLLTNEIALNENAKELSSKNNEKNKTDKKDSKAINWGNLKSIVVFKAYAEHVEGYLKEHGMGGTNEEQIKALNIVLENIKAHAEEEHVKVRGIVHHLDAKKNADDSFELSMVKPHLHVMIEYYRQISGKRERKRLNTIKKWLEKCGLIYRESDSTLLEKSIRFIDPHNQGDYCRMVAYLTHETETAILEGKYTYPRENLVTNVSQKEQDMIYDKFNKYYNAPLIADSEGNLYFDKDYAYKTARRRYYELGKMGNPFETMYDNEELDWKLDPKFKKSAQEGYVQGMEEYVKSNPKINRVSIYIVGEPDIGKTTSAKLALLRMGRTVREIEKSAGTGATDKVKPGECIIYNDIYPLDAKSIADNKITELYKRLMDNGYLTGDFVIITSNKDFNEFVKFETEKGENPDAIRSRYIVIEFDKRKNINITYPKSMRGMSTDIDEKIEKFAEFYAYFEDEIKKYQSDKEKGLQNRENIKEMATLKIEKYRKAVKTDNERVISDMEKQQDESQKPMVSEAEDTYTYSDSETIKEDSCEEADNDEFMIPTSLDDPMWYEMVKSFV